MDKAGSVTFLRRQAVGGNTYNAGDSASFEPKLATKLQSLGVARPYQDQPAEAEKEMRALTPGKASGYVTKA